MSHYIVLVKQVPDVTRITDNAFDLENGTLIRTRLASVINELDTHALAAADKMNRLGKDKGKIVASTNGANPSNCLHCKTCQRKCPFDNIRWTAPEGGGGSRYKNM